MFQLTHRVCNVPFNQAPAKQLFINRRYSAALFHRDGLGMDAGWTRDGRGMDAGWTRDGRGMDAGWTRDGRGMDAGWTRDGRGMDAGWTRDGRGIYRHFSRLIPIYFYIVSFIILNGEDT